MEVNQAAVKAIKDALDTAVCGSVDCLQNYIKLTGKMPASRELVVQAYQRGQSQLYMLAEYVKTLLDGNSAIFEDLDG